MTKKENTNSVAFAGGCFWCIEAVFERLRGVVSVTPGYTGGTVKNPSYELVCGGATGHAEAIKIEYAPSEISFNDLLTVFFVVHDPTTMNRQGADVGTQYRSAIFYTTEDQKKEAASFIKKLNASGLSVVTELQPLGDFYEAEEYHRKYYQTNRGAPYCEIVINPKIEMLEARFQELLKEQKTKHEKR